MFKLNKSIIYVYSNSFDLFLYIYIYMYKRTQKLKRCKLLKNFDYILFDFIFSIVKSNMRKTILLVFFFFPYHFSGSNWNLKVTYNSQKIVR